MDFEHIRVKEICHVLRYTPSTRHWVAKNRKNHIVGIQLSGEARHDLGYQKFVLSRNCIYFFNQRDDYEVEVQEVGEALSIHFTTYEEIDADSFCIPVGSREEILGILHRAEQYRGRSEGELMTMSFLYRLLGELARLREKTYFPKDRRVVAAKEYMDGHFCEKGCLAEAIACSGVTARRFSTLFKLHFDITPNRYLVMQRLEQAKQLLRVESLSIAQIAADCGFSDVYYFSKLFKKEVGTSPARWRRT